MLIFGEYVCLSREEIVSLFFAVGYEHFFLAHHVFVVDDYVDGVRDCHNFHKVVEKEIFTVDLELLWLDFRRALFLIVLLNLYLFLRCLVLRVCLRLLLL